MAWFHLDSKTSEVSLESRFRGQRSPIRALVRAFAQRLLTSVSIAPHYTALEEPTVANVVGVLEGSDPTLRDEAVIFTGHMDHVGAIGYWASQRYLNSMGPATVVIWGARALRTARPAVAGNRRPVGRAAVPRSAPQLGRRRRSC